MRLLRVGLLGCGVMGRRHLEALLELALARNIFIWVWDLNLAKINHPGFNHSAVRLCGSAEEFYGQSFDLLIVALHPANRAEIHGKLTDGLFELAKVLLEKPMRSANGSNGSDFGLPEKLIETIRPRCWVNFSRHRDPLTPLLIKLLKGEVEGIPGVGDTIRIVCEQLKDRRIHSPKRPSEPLAFQEPHDVASILYVLDALGIHGKLNPCSSTCSDLLLTGGGRLEFAGESNSTLQTEDGLVTVDIHSSFQSSKWAKSTDLCYEGVDRRFYWCHVNYLAHDPDSGLPSETEYRALWVRDVETGEIIYDAGQQESSIIKWGFRYLNVVTMDRFLDMLDEDPFPSNFSLALEVERISAELYAMQRRHRVV